MAVCGLRGRLTQWVLAVLLLQAKKSLPLGGTSEPLKERLPSAGEAIFCELTATQEGHLVVPGPQGQTRRVPLKAEAQLSYEEVPLASSGDRLRALHRTTVVVDAEKKRTVRTLRESVRFIRVGASSPSKLHLFSPAGPLTAEELRMLEAPADPYLYDRLAGPSAPQVGASWEVPAELVQALFWLDSVEQPSLRVSVEEADAEKIVLRLAGQARGDFLAAPATLTVDGRFEYDLAQGLYRRVELDIQEVKAPGPVEAGLEGTLRLVLKRSRGTAKWLQERTVRALAAGGAEASADYLVYDHPEGIYRLFYSRRWRLHGADRSTLVLKWIEGRSLVGQCNVRVAHRASPGTHVDPERFREQIVQALARYQPQIVQQGEVPSESGLWTYRLSLAGIQAGGEPLLWHYYVVAGRDGQHVLFIFAVPAAQAERFAAADLALVQSIQMPAPSPAEATARAPEPEGFRQRSPAAGNGEPTAQP
jgi:hypothetical protein